MPKLINAATQQAQLDSPVEETSLPDLESSPVTTVTFEFAGKSPVKVKMKTGRAKSLCRSLCKRNEWTQDE